jgi:tetratricopeptide (TPR) repeat protein
MTKLLFLVLLLLSSTSRGSAKANPSLQSFRDQIYEAYVLNNMPRWAQAVSAMEVAYRSNPHEELLYDLLLAQYGLIGYYLGNNREREGAALLDNAQTLLRRLENLPAFQAQAHAFDAAFLAFRISLQPLRAAVLGLRSSQAATRSTEANSRYARAWVERGNIMFFAPAPFGSKERAISYYQRAVRTMEENMHPSHRWLYLSTLVSLANAFEKTGNIQMALQTVEKALRFEPRFKWAKEELLPRLQATQSGN